MKCLQQVQLNLFQLVKINITEDKYMSITFKAQLPQSKLDKDLQELADEFDKILAHQRLVEQTALSYTKQRKPKVLKRFHIKINRFFK